MQSGGPERLAGVKLGDSPTFGTSLWSNKKSVDGEGEEQHQTQREPRAAVNTQPVSKPC